MRHHFLIGLAVVGLAASAQADDVLAPASQRFAVDTDEVPTFRQHVMPLLGRLGCNGRACHGSFQGRGDFRLSLFGYDFKMDHTGLASPDNGRIDLENPVESLILEKATDTMPHEGGKRTDVGSWEYRILLNWIKGGAKPYNPATDADFVRLEVKPSELRFRQAGQQTQLQAIAVWSDGTREDVTPMCRFQTNDDSVAAIDKNGLVTSGAAGDTHVVVYFDTGVAPIPVMQPASNLANSAYPTVPTPTTIDKLVVQKLQKLHIVPSELASDAEFLRRVSLDLAGTLPTAGEVEAFLADSTSDKRSRKIEELLERPTYAAWWATKLCDFTGNNSEQLVNATPTGGQESDDWYEWMLKRVEENTPYDELVAGILTGTSRQPGQSYREYCEEMSSLYRKGAEESYADREALDLFWARRNMRKPEDKALTFAYTFLGMRIQCAQCHKHPFDRWTQDDYKSFTNFFTRINHGQSPEARREYREMIAEMGLEKEQGGNLRRELQRRLRKGETVPFNELVIGKPRTGNAKSKGKAKSKYANSATPNKAKLLGGAVVDLNEYEDPRTALMEWLRDPGNPYFAMAFVNRVWANYFNVGIIEPPDDISLANPPSNKALLEYLTQGFIDHNYDMKWLHREITNSRTYQLSWKPNETNQLDRRNFSHAIVRRLPAEVAYDAIQQATSSDKYAVSMRDNLELRAIAYPAPGRRGARRPQDTYTLDVFGRSTRESNCDCDRSNDTSLLQTVFLQNDNLMLSWIDRDKIGWVDEVTAEFATERTAHDEKVQTLQAKVARDRKLLGVAYQKMKQLDKGDEKRRAKARNVIQSARARIDAAQAELKQLESEPPPEATIAAADLDGLIRQAYLRTLGRYPTNDEVSRSREYINDAEDSVDGLRGVLWALLNTKEFIVNH